MVHKVEEDEKVAHPELRAADVEKSPTASASKTNAGADVKSPEGRAVTYTDTENSTTPYRCCCYEMKGDAIDTPERKRMLAQVCLIFMLISSYYAMVLTNWATERTGASVSSQKEGSASMWIQASAQWIALLMYIWSLIAPDLFPDRDFS